MKTGTKTMQWVAVAQVTGRLQALVTREFLARGGVPAAVAGNFTVLVPAAHLMEAQMLLYPEPRAGEVFCVPGGVGVGG